MTKAKRYVSFLLTITLLLSMIPMRVSAETAASAQAPASDRIQAECQITTTWGEYYSGIITLKNISNQTIENWKISGICADEIDYIYDAQIMEHTGTSYIIKNNNWNANIAPGETVSFGFNAKIDKNAKIDETMEVDKGIFDIQLIDNHSAPVTAPDTFEVIFTVTSDWGTGYNASFEVRNHTDKVMENWRLEFDFDRNINSIWNANIIAHEGNHYIIQNDGWNANIPANGSVTFGCAGSPGNLSVKPDNYILHDEGEEGNEDDGKDITCQLMIDTSAFIPVDEEGMAFYTGQKIAALTGTLSDTQNVTAMTLTIKCGNLELLNTSITPAASWSYKKPNLPTAMYNQITVTAVMKNGKTVEESISLIQFSEENFDESLLDTNDNDKDGLLNWLEDVFGTDKNNPDTDGDGLTDYEEIFITFTDPLLWDTDGTGISDGEQDFDNDSLNNIQECFYGTNPYNPDTDGDGLSDNDEIFVYFTDPLEADTDGDGLTDSEELALGLDPLDPVTDGITPDAQRIFEQEISADSYVFDKINEEENPYLISVELKGTGLAEQHLSVDESDYAHFIENNAILGKTIDFHYDDDLEIEQAELTFEIKDGYISNDGSTYARVNPEFEGINRYQFFMFSEEINMPVPIQTYYDADDNTVSATVSENGTYFIMDVEKWFALLGIEPTQLEQSNSNEVSLATSTQTQVFLSATAPFSAAVSAYDTASEIIAQNAADIATAGETYTYTDGPTHGIIYDANSESAFSAGVLARNGKVILVPYDSPNIGIYDSVTNTYTDGPEIYPTGIGRCAFGDGVLAPNGKIILVPYDSPNIGIYDPTANTYTMGPKIDKYHADFGRGVIAPNGKIIFIPGFFNRNIGIYDPITNTYTQGPKVTDIDNAFSEGVLAPNGKIILLPYNSNYIGIYDPITNTYTQGPKATRVTEDKDPFRIYPSGVLAPNGKIIMARGTSSFDSNVVGIYDPVTNTYTEGPSPGKKFHGYRDTVLTSDGKIILVSGYGNKDIYDPIANTYTEGLFVGKDFSGGVLLPNGNILLVPAYQNINLGILERNVPTEYSAILANTFQKITLANPLMRNGWTDTDGDGLTDYEEALSDLITWNADGSVKELPTISELYDTVKKDEHMGEEVLQKYFSTYLPQNQFDVVRVLPVSSSPVDVDSDGDGYSDYDEVKKHFTNPLISNITVTKLKNEQFLDIVEIKDDKTTVHYYGGSQMWWTEDSVSRDHGCGVAAAANTMAYMAFSDSKYQDLYPENASLEKTVFLNYMTELLKYVTVPIVGQSFGLSSMQFEDGVIRYSRVCRVNLYPALSFKLATEENIIDYIKSGLKKDKPVVMLNDYNTTLKNKKIPYFHLDGSSGSQAFDHHFVTITEIAEDDIAGTAVVKVSTWGAYAYIDIADYMDGWLSSVVYFE